MPKGRKGKEVDPAQFDFFSLAEVNSEIQKEADGLGVNTETLLSGFVADQSVTITKHPIDAKKSLKKLEKKEIDPLFALHAMMKNS